MHIRERIEELRRLMARRQIDVCLIPSCDFHQSEYVGAHFKCREFITGFTGSAGTAAITRTEAGLWTDGRYFIQAEQELQGSGITLYRMGDPGVCTIETWLDSRLPQNGTLGLDGRVFSASDGQNYERLAAGKQARLEYRCDLVGAIWKDRPPLPQEPVFLLEERDCGESAASKLKRLRAAMEQSGAAVHLLTTLDEIAWLLNLRGHDIAYSPLFLAYAVILPDSVHLFADEAKFSASIRQRLAEDGVRLHPYDTVDAFVSRLDPGQTVLLDPHLVNYTLWRCLPDGIKTAEAANPCILFKARKNETEIKNLRAAHIKDGVAHTRFLYWLKTHIGKEPITERTAIEKLEQFRAEQGGFLGPGFAPISAFGTHAAICHYSVTPETDCELKEGFVYLCDTGGNYREGSTDITRTVVLGSVADEVKKHFTNVLRGNLALARAVFLAGCTGNNLDILARQYLWEEHLDFKHGTGHGVGYLLNVHEGPCSIRWQRRADDAALESGMVLSDEPGLYMEGAYGIRLENELLVREDVKNEYGQFLRFDVLTCVPFDLDAVDPTLMQDTEKKQLNAYHKWVFDVLSPYLDADERAWLQVSTRAI